jgi:hypothetical protein
LFMFEAWVTQFDHALNGDESALMSLVIVAAFMSSIWSMFRPWIFPIYRQNRPSKFSMWLLLALAFYFRPQCLCHCELKLYLCPNHQKH